MWRLLMNSQISDLHSSALEILQRVGVRVDNMYLLKKLDEVGADIDYEKRLVKLPPYIVEEFIRKVPSHYVMGGRTPKSDLFVGGGKAYARTNTGCDHIIDMDTGEWREATEKDAIDAVILQDALENVNFCGSWLHSSDEPPESRDVYTLEIMLENTEKHIFAQPYSPEAFRAMIDMAKVVVGEDGLKWRPLISVFVAPTSPLVFSEQNTQYLIDGVEHGIPLVPCTTPISGISGPITLAGQVVLPHAEILACATMAEMLKPGAPVAYTPRPNTMDMRTIQVLWGSIEFALAAVALVQLGRHIGFPVDFHIGTDSMVPDGQAAIEKTMGTVLAFLVKTDTITGAGFVEAIKTASFEQLVIDNEILAIGKRIAEGIDVNVETIALDVIEKVGPGGNFLKMEHTRKHYQKEHFIPSILKRDVRSVWEETGAKDLAETAKEKVKMILKEHEPLALDKDIQKELRSILNRVRKNLG